jgi:hypothetical protein
MIFKFYRNVDNLENWQRAPKVKPTIRQKRVDNYNQNVPKRSRQYISPTHRVVFTIYSSAGMNYSRSRML